MPSCPRCQQFVATKAVNCSTCGLELKAHGHASIPLHRAQGNQFLCTNCAYELDNSCTYPQRPHAQECSLYRDANKPVTQPASHIKPGRRGNTGGNLSGQGAERPAWRVWLQDSPAGLVLLGLLGIAMFWALRR
jgi:hypothetical protein